MFTASPAALSQTLSGNNNESYWSVIATTAPVLALSLVIEVRATARQWSTQKGKGKKRRSRLPGRVERVTMSALYAATGVQLGLVFLVSLLCLLNGHSSRSLAFWVIISMCEALVLLALTPIVAFSSAATRDVIQGIVFALPLAVVRVVINISNRRAVITLDLVSREVRQARFQNVMNIAEATSRLVKVEAVLEEQPDHAAAIAYRAETVTYLADAREWQMKLDGHKRQIAEYQKRSRNVSAIYERIAARTMSGAEEIRRSLRNISI
jgi:hypothetical protein